MLQTELAALSAHLGARRESILRKWGDGVRNDVTLTSGDALPRAELNDHIPAVLAAFERELTRSATSNDVLPTEGNQNAAAHGLHRWQQGYNLREVVRELGRLNVCMVEELEGYASAHPALEHEVMATARRLWAASCSVGIEESTAQYFRLQETEAAGHLDDLERALEEVRELERHRAELWREAAHDLRGNVGVVVNVTAGLARGGLGNPRSEPFLPLLQRNVASLHLLLDDVTDLARLQAGREKRQLSQFDAATLIGDLCEGLTPLATERGLYLRHGGPAPFQTEGDPVKVRRIAQNLILNALKYTVSGGVTVAWGDSDQADRKRWMLSISDTGPGLRSGPDAPLATALEAATQLTGDPQAPLPDPTPDKPSPDARSSAPSSAPSADPAAGLPEVPASRVLRATPHRAGEGIGLSIVKRLAELLDASIELDSSAQTGTTFRILLPRRYQPPPQQGQ